MSKVSVSNNTTATARYLQGIGLLEIFRRKHNWENLAAAEQQFAWATQLDPSYKAARFYLGVSQEIIGKHEDATDQFETLLLQRSESEQPDIEVLYNLGLSYFHQYRRPAYEAAVRYLTQIIRLTTESRFENEEIRERRRRESMNLISRAVLAQVFSHMSILPVNTDPDEFRPHAEKNFELAMKTAHDALQEFDRDREKLDPSLVQDIGWGLHNAMGHALLYAFKRRPNPELLNKSVREFLAALEFDPENYRVLSNLGSAYQSLAKHAKELDDDSWVSYLDRAKDAFFRVLQLKPNYDFAYVRLSQIALSRGDTSEARRLLSLAREYRSEMTAEYLNNLSDQIEAASASAPATY